MSGTAGHACRHCHKRIAREATSCPHCKREQRDAALWAAGWRVILDRPQIPPSWPAECGMPQPGQSCQACGNAAWRRQGDGIVCITCHPSDVVRPDEEIGTGTSRASEEQAA